VSQAALCGLLLALVSQEPSQEPTARAWGGEIWLSPSNVPAEQGVATAAENGVFGPDHNWLIEGRGVEPDMVADNLPHATFEGQDA
jgi:tricorn protease